MSTETSQPVESVRKSHQRLTRVALLSIVLLCCLVFWGKRTLQPKYQGKTAEELFNEISTGSSGSEYVAKDPAVIALRHLGTNAVWFLWRETKHKEFRWLNSLQQRFDRLVGKNQNIPPDFGRAGTAWVVLFQFGPETEVLIPEALELLKQGKPNEAAFAAMLLGRTQRQPDVVVPAILQSLAVTNRNMDHRISHIVALRELGPSAKAALPYLQARLADPAVASTREGYWVAKAILTINGPGPEVAYFTTNLVAGNFLRSYDNLAPLEHLGTNARPAALELQKFMLTLTNAEDSARVQAIIKKIDPEGIYQKP